MKNNRNYYLLSNQLKICMAILGFNGFLSMNIFAQDWIKGCDNLAGMTTTELSLLRNQIYARHGYVFSSPTLKEYFQKQNWYKPNPDFNPDNLSDNELTCVKSISIYEQKAHSSIKQIGKENIIRLKYHLDGAEYVQQNSTTTIDHVLYENNFNNKKTEIPEAWHINGLEHISFTKQNYSSKSLTLEIDKESGQGSIIIPVSSSPISTLEISLYISDKYIQKYTDVIFSPTIISVGLYNTDVPCTVKDPLDSYTNKCSWGGVEISPIWDSTTSPNKRQANSFAFFNKFIGVGKGVSPNTWAKITIQTDLLGGITTVWVNGDPIDDSCILDKSGDYNAIEIHASGPVKFKVDDIKLYALNAKAILETYISPSGKTYFLPKGQGIRVVHKDINGDGEAEMLEIVLPVDCNPLFVLDRKYELTAEWQDIDVVDIDKHDNYQEIAFGDNGPDEYHTTTFYRYNPKIGIQKIGEVGGVAVQTLLDTVA